MNTKDYEQAYARALQEEVHRTGNYRETLGILRLLTQLASIAMLLLALWPWPPGFYSVLRWAVFSTALLGLTDNRPRLLLLLPACLFNPLVSVPLERAAWQILDIGTATLFFRLLGHDKVRGQIAAVERDKRLQSARAFVMWYAASCGDTLDQMGLGGSHKFHSPEMMDRIKLADQATLDMLHEQLRNAFDATLPARKAVRDAREEAEHGPLRSATISGVTYNWRSRLPGVPVEISQHVQGRQRRNAS